MPGIEFPIDLEWLTELVFGDLVPPWVGPLVGVALALFFLLWLFHLLLGVVRKAVELWAEHLRPIFYRPADRRRAAQRRRFADHIEHELRRLNSLEEWSDYRYAELEAEVEAEGYRKTSGLWSLLPPRSGLRRERSLSKALENSRERLILLEGEPGAGKSVALRHVAQSMARRAMRARSTACVIPIYVNLRELIRADGEAMDAALMRGFVLKSLNRVNTRDIEVFLEREFDRGLAEGTWLFLFDSFDELSEVLSSTEADGIIRCYADAISDFLHGMNQCRGIIASRSFRSPSPLGWPHFRVLPLSERRRLELIRKAALEPGSQRALLAELQMGSDEIRAMAANPMFLSLLCEHVKISGELPETAHSVFDTYIEKRLFRDSERVRLRYGLEPVELRSVAETVAFTITLTSGLGLAPSRRALMEAMLGAGVQVSQSMAKSLNALEYIKLARSETATTRNKSRSFTFSHRRFHEYFATCVVLRDPSLIHPRRLLTDGRWRETAVVMCQTQPPEALAPMIHEASEILTMMVSQTPNLIEDLTPHLVEASEGKHRSELDKAASVRKPFPWPPGALHLLGLLQDGFRGRASMLPDGIRNQAARLVLSATCAGTLPDRKWALEVAGVVPERLLGGILTKALEENSRLVKDVAYQQVGLLRRIPERIAESIRLRLVAWEGVITLWRERHTREAYLARIDHSSGFLEYFRFTLVGAVIDLAIHLALASVVLLASTRRPEPSFPVSVFLALLILSHASVYSRPIPLLVIYAVRAVLPVLVALAGLVGILSGRFQAGHLQWLAAFYLVSWYPAAVMVNADTPDFRHPIWYPLYPILLVCIPILRGPRKTQGIWNQVVKSAETALFAAIYYGIMYLGFRLAESVPPVGWVVFTILFAPVALDLCGLGVEVVRRVMDLRRWRHWLRQSQQNVTADELADLLEQFRTEGFRARVVKTIRQQGRLLPNQGTALQIKNLISHFENAEAVQEPEAPAWILRLIRHRWNIPGVFLGAWLLQVREHLRELRRPSPVSHQEYLDELCELLEQIEARQ